jgi:hypothetical protein
LDGGQQPKEQIIAEEHFLRIGLIGWRLCRVGRGVHLTANGRRGFPISLYFLIVKGTLKFLKDFKNQGSIWVGGSLTIAEVSVAVHFPKIALIA